MKSMRNQQKGDLERAEMLLKQVKPNLKLKEFDESTIGGLEEAMDLFEKWNSEEKMREAYECWGDYQTVKQKHKIAIDFYQKSLTIQVALYGEINEATWKLYFKIGNGFNYLVDLKPAKPYLFKALELAKAIFGEEGMNTAIVYSAIGFWHFCQDNFTKAIEYYQKTMRIEEKQDPVPISSLSITYINIATNYTSCYNLKKAIQFFEKGVILLKKNLPPMHEDFSHIYHNYADLYNRKGDDNRAILFAKQAIEVANYNNDMNVVFSYHLLMKIYQSQGKDKKALEFGEKAIEVLVKYKREKHRVNIAISTYISSIYQKRGNHEKAFSLIKKSIQIAKELYGPHGIVLANTMRAMAEYYMNRDMFTKAENHCYEALNILNYCKDDRLRCTSFIYQTLGSLYTKFQKTESAISAYHKAILFSTVGYEEQDVYDYPFFDIKNIDFEIKKNPSLWLQLFSFKASAFFQYFLKHTKNLKDLKAAFRGYEVTYYFWEQIQHSFQSNQSKLIILKSIEQHLFQAIATTYTLFETTEEQKYLNHTFEFVERNKAYLMLSDKQEKNAKQATSLPTELLEREEELQGRLTSLQKNIQRQKQKGEKADKVKLQELENDYFSSYNEFEDLKKQLEKRYPEYYRLKYSATTVSIPNLQSSLQENQTVLNYFIGEEKIYLFAITSNEHEVFALDKPSNWKDLIQNYLQSIKFHQKTEFLQHSFTLYQTLLQEALHHIIDPFAEEGEQRQVFIIPHAELHYLPFETLIVSEPNTPTLYSDLDYLLKHCQISYHYSATLLHLGLQKQAEAMAERAPIDIAFTGFAPVYASSSNAQKQALELLQKEYAVAANRSEAVRSDGTWMPLPYSKLEVENIAQLFEQEGLRSNAFLYESANKSNLEEQIGKSRFVLIAAHGIVNNQYPELSGLILAEDGSGKFKSETTEVLEDLGTDRSKIELQKATDDCILNMKEVAMIPMSADLVVLSSCESGIGELHKGEGMMAVNRGFLTSGAKNVVSTLFKVNDRASSELTQLLFQYILEGENFAAALQKAKLGLLKKEGMDPKAWSGFVLFGAGRGES